MKTKADAYRDKTRALLELWGAEITRLQAKARLLEADARLKALGQVEELQRGYNDAFRQFNDMKVDSNAKLEKLRASFQETADKARRAIQDLTAQAV